MFAQCVGHILVTKRGNEVAENDRFWHPDSRFLLDRHIIVSTTTIMCMGLAR